MVVNSYYCTPCTSKEFRTADDGLGTFKNLVKTTRPIYVLCIMKTPTDRADCGSRDRASVAGQY